jgi:hypothetical protein
MTLKQIVKEGEELPRFYGIAYFDYMRRQGVAYPVPLNLVVNTARNWWFALTKWRPSRFELELSMLTGMKYREGYNAGYADALLTLDGLIGKGYQKAPEK